MEIIANVIDRRDGRSIFAAAETEDEGNRFSVLLASSSSPSHVFKKYERRQNLSGNRRFFHNTLKLGKSA